MGIARHVRRASTKRLETRWVLLLSGAPFAAQKYSKQWAATTLLVQSATLNFATFAETTINFARALVLMSHTSRS